MCETVQWFAGIGDWTIKFLRFALLFNGSYWRFFFESWCHAIMIPDVHDNSWCSTCVYVAVACCAESDSNPYKQACFSIVQLCRKYRQCSKKKKMLTCSFCMYLRFKWIERYVVDKCSFCVRNAYQRWLGIVCMDSGNWIVLGMTGGWTHILPHYPPPFFFHHLASTFQFLFTKW